MNIINIRKATTNDDSASVQMIADDALGKTRAHFQAPLPKAYLMAFENINVNRVKVRSGGF